MINQHLFYPEINRLFWYKTTVKKELHVTNPCCAHGCFVVFKSFSCSELKVVSRFLKSTSKKAETGVGSRGVYNLRQVVCGQARMCGATFIKFPERTMDLRSDRVSAVRSGVFFSQRVDASTTHSSSSILLIQRKSSLLA